MESQWWRFIRIWATVAPATLLGLYLFFWLMLGVSGIFENTSAISVVLRCAGLLFGVLLFTWPAANAAYIKALNPDVSAIQSVRFQLLFAISIVSQLILVVLSESGFTDSILASDAAIFTSLFIVAGFAIVIVVLIYYWRAAKIILLAAGKPTFLSDILAVTASLIVLPISIFWLQKLPKAL